MTTALLIKTDGQHRAVELPDERSYEILRDLIGGTLDSVSNKDGSVIGYLHDEGLLIGLPINAVASLMFSRPLVGDVVLVGALDENGNYDGENHELPEGYFSERYLAFLSQVSHDSEVLTAVGNAIAEMDFSHSVYALTDEQMGKYLETGELPTDAKKV